MLYLSLPLLYENKLFNNYIDQFISLNPDKAKIPMKIEYLHGSYPWSLWNGGSNSNYGNAVLYNEMQDIVKNTSSPHAIDCSNIYLNDSDLSDIHQNIILEIESNTGSAFEVSDLKLYNYIKDHYPDAEFIFSNNAELFNTFKFIDCLVCFIGFCSVSSIVYIINDIKDDAILQIKASDCWYF